MIRKQYLYGFSLVIFCCSCSGLGITIPTKIPVVRSAWVEKWLYDPTCEPPCWEGLVPGTTSAEMAYKKLKSLNGVQVEHNAYDMNINYMTDWIINNGEGDGYAIIDKQTKIVTDIYLLLLTNRLQVQEVIAEYGEPTHLVVNNCHSEIFSNSCEIYIVFIDKGIALLFSVPIKIKDSKFSFRILPAEEVYQIRLVDSHILSDRVSRNIDQIFSWNGYGKYIGDW